MGPLIPLALSKESNQTVFIDDVPSGAACNCICLSCGVPLIAKKGMVNVHHFSHEGRTVDDERLCEFSIERAIYLMIARILEEQKELLVPEYTLRLSRPLLNILVEGSLIEPALIAVKGFKGDSNAQLEGGDKSLFLESDIGLMALTVDMKPKRLTRRQHVAPEFVNDRRLPQLVIALHGIVQLFLAHKRGYKALLSNILLEQIDNKEWVYHPDEEPLKAEFQKQCHEASTSLPQVGIRKKNIIQKKKLHRSPVVPTNSLDFKPEDTQARLEELIEQVNKIVELGNQTGDLCKNCYFMNEPNVLECEYCSHRSLESTSLDEDYLYCISNKYECWLYPMYSLKVLPKKN